MFESISNVPSGGSRKLSEKQELPPSLFYRFDEAVDEIVAQVRNSNRPSINRRLVDAILWVKRQNSDEARHLLQGVREKWIVPYAMDRGQMGEAALELSDILSEPDGEMDHARSAYRALALMDPFRSFSSLSPSLSISPMEDDAGDASRFTPVASTLEQRIPALRAESVIAPYGLDDLGAPVSREAKIVHDQVTRFGVPPSPLSPRLPSVETGMDAYAHRAQESSAYLRALIKLHRPVMLDATLLTHTIHLLEGGPEWTKQLQRYASSLIANMHQDDGERFRHALHDAQYATQLLKSLSFQSSQPHLPLDFSLPQVRRISVVPKTSFVRSIFTRASSVISSWFGKKAA